MGPQPFFLAMCLLVSPLSLSKETLPIILHTFDLCANYSLTLACQLLLLLAEPVNCCMAKQLATVAWHSLSRLVMSLPPHMVP
ncbi:hypothetical protein V8C86DRAFT_2574649 [Haematococcus lacustris]